MIKQFVKDKVIKYLNQKGLTVVPFDSREAQLEKVRNKWLTNQNINTIIDVGASDGGFASKARELFRGAKIFSFEPIPSSYKILTKKFASDKNFKAINIALGNTVGELEFYLNEHIGASSFLDTSSLIIDAIPYAKNYSKIKVNIDKLDNIVDVGDLTPNIMLKLDVQGYEVEVLNGAEMLLKEVQIIYTELSFSELYKGQPLINDVVDFLKERGFRIIGIENVSRNKNDGTFLQADAFFIKYK